MVKIINFILFYAIVIIIIIYILAITIIILLNVRSQAKLNNVIKLLIFIVCGIISYYDTCLFISSFLHSIIIMLQLASQKFWCHRTMNNAQISSGC